MRQHDEHFRRTYQDAGHPYGCPDGHTGAGADRDSYACSYGHAYADSDVNPDAYARV